MRQSRGFQGETGILPKVKLGVCAVYLIAYWNGSVSFFRLKTDNMHLFLLSGFYIKMMDRVDHPEEIVDGDNIQRFILQWIF